MTPAIKSEVAWGIFAAIVVGCGLIVIIVGIQVAIEDIKRRRKGKHG